MGAVELKSDIHKIVDRIQNEQLLQTLYDFLVAKEKSKTGNLWNSLSEEQKQEVLLAFEESEDESKLIDSEKVFNRKKRKSFLPKKLKRILMLLKSLSI